MTDHRISKGIANKTTPLEQIYAPAIRHAMCKTEGIYNSQTILRDKILEPTAICGIHRIDSKALIQETTAFSERLEEVETFCNSTLDARIGFEQEESLYGGYLKGIQS